MKPDTQKIGPLEGRCWEKDPIPLLSNMFCQDLTPQDILQPLSIDLNFNEILVGLLKVMDLEEKVGKIKIKLIMYVSC